MCSLSALDDKWVARGWGAPVVALHGRSGRLVVSVGRSAGQMADGGGCKLEGMGTGVGELK